MSVNIFNSTLTLFCVFIVNRVSCSEHGFSYPGRRRESQASCSWSYVANYCCKLSNIKNTKSFLIRNFFEFLKKCIFSNPTRQKILSSDRKNSIFLIENKKSWQWHVWLFQKYFVSECFCFFDIDLNWFLLQRFLFNKISLQDVPGLIALLQDGETIEDLLKLSPEQLLTRWVNYQLDKVTKRTFRWFYTL